MDIADELQLRILGLQPRVLTLDSGEPLRERVGRLGPRPALLRRQTYELACIASTTPHNEMGRVETFTTKQSTKLASLARVGLLENLPLVLRAEPPSLGLRSHFRRGA